jgi:hypothetical protein
MKIKSDDHIWRSICAGFSPSKTALPPASKCLLQWLNSLGAKAPHPGGCQILSPKILEVSLQHRFGTQQVERRGEGNEFMSEEKLDEDAMEKDISSLGSRQSSTPNKPGEQLIRDLR